jgi:hypothetical protein
MLAFEASPASFPTQAQWGSDRAHEVGENEPLLIVRSDYLAAAAL